jgi:hypothetical protein
MCWRLWSSWHCVGGFLERLLWFSEKPASAPAAFPTAEAVVDFAGLAARLEAAPFQNVTPRPFKT